MSIFSRIFGLQSKSVDKTESGSPEIIRLGEFEKELRKLLGKDVYLARSDYKPLCTDYKDLYEQFSTLKKSKTLEYFSYLSRCSGGYGLETALFTLIKRKKQLRNS